MFNLYRLDQVQPSDREQVGEHGFYLSQLAQTSYPIVPSLVVPVQAFRIFLNQINWLEPLFADLPDSSLYLDVKNPCQLQAIARQIRNEMMASPAPDALIEAIIAETQTWQASSLVLYPSVSIPENTTLSLKSTELLQPQICWAETAAIAQSLQAVWGELFRAKSLLHWQHAGVQLHQMGIAVVVQPLRPAIASGTIHINDHQAVVQAFRGVALPSIYPMLVADTYYLDPDTSDLQNQIIGKKLLSCTPLSDQHEVNSKHLGTQNHALPPNVHAALPCQILAEEHQHTPVLNQAQFQALVALAQEARSLLRSCFRLSWSMETSADGKSWCLFISRAHVLPSTLPIKTRIHTTVSAHQVARYENSSNQPSNQLASLSSLSTAVLLNGLAASKGQAIGTIYKIHPTQPKPHHLNKDSILVTTTIAPDWLPLLKQAVGIITEQGGLTSHAAILARELGIPAIVNAANALQHLHSGDRVVLDGDRGEVYRANTLDDNPLTQSPSTLHPSPSTLHPSPFTLHPSHSTLHPSLSPLRTQLLVNLSQLRSLESAKTLAVDGVGLLRSELLALDVLDYQHPYVWLSADRHQDFVDRMATAIAQVAAVFFPRPVWYRSLDLRSHEFYNLPGGENTPIEVNPMLGLRGTLSYVHSPTLFNLELAALAQAQSQGYTNLHLLLPFVRTVEEFVFCRQQVIAAGLTTHAPLQLWIMAEVPSVIWLLPAYVKAGVQGISIGSNDLAQLVLAVDRDGGKIGDEYSAKHPAVMGAIAQLIQQARQLNLPCSICGQAPAQYPEMVSSLVNWGITSISVEMSAVAQTHQAIAQAEQQQES